MVSASSDDLCELELPPSNLFSSLTPLMVPLIFFELLEEKTVSRDVAPADEGQRELDDKNGRDPSEYSPRERGEGHLSEEGEERGWEDEGEGEGSD